MFFLFVMKRYIFFCLFFYVFVSPLFAIDFMDIKLGGTVDETLTSFKQSKLISIDTASIQIVRPVQNERFAHSLHSVIKFTGDFQGKCWISVNTHDAFTLENAYSASSCGLSFSFSQASKSDYEKKLAILTRKYGPSNQKSEFGDLQWQTSDALITISYHSNGSISIYCMIKK